jgi:3-keto-disaccharide hydrolase
MNLARSRQIRWSGAILAPLTFGLVILVSNMSSFGEEYLTGIEWTEPLVVTPGRGGGPPSDAIVLFDGKDLSAWEHGENWSVQDGAAVVGKGTIETKQRFGDCQLHIEWSAPKPAVGQGQDRGNSGIFLMGIYEIQVLDSYQSKTYFDGQAGGIYKQTPPMVNAMCPPGQWNAYDIIWERPRFASDGSLKSPAVITALHNGILILNHFELLGNTPYNRPPEYRAHEDKLPITLQDHGHPVRFRNIWIREIKPIEGKRVREPYLRDGDKERPVGK